ncbi:MAG: hypothetical protein NZ700_08390 [Gemmataceae bacterium]|nr:hypothetical protein [Gemmataceae bacterium]MDW8266149.1 hypothetical protein [Gemmataceae bacterium]
MRGKESCEFEKRAYSLLAAGAVVVLFLGLMERGPSVSVLIPVLVGAGGISARWRLAPLLVLASVILACVEQLPTTGPDRGRSWEPAELVIAVAVLVYMAAQYRLQALERAVRTAERPAAPANRASGEPAEVGNIDEVARLPLVALVCVAAAQFLWDQLPTPWFSVGLPTDLGRLVALIWGTTLGVLVLNGLTAYWAWRRLPPGEAVLWLQDVLWRETRREQRRIGLWLAWSRRRRERRKT